MEPEKILPFLVEPKPATNLKEGVTAHSKVSRTGALQPDVV